MFEKTPKGYTQLQHTFARAIEDVERSNALWVRAADLYVSIIERNKPADRREAFERERNRLLGLVGNSDAQAIAADIGNYLKATAKTPP